MKVLKATYEQKQNLEGTYLQGVYLQFIEDNSGNWVVNENVLNDANFKAVHEQLSALPKIDYKPKEINI